PGARDMVGLDKSRTSFSLQVFHSLGIQRKITLCLSPTSGVVQLGKVEHESQPGSEIFRSLTLTGKLKTHSIEAAAYVSAAFIRRRTIVGELKFPWTSSNHVHQSLIWWVWAGQHFEIDCVQFKPFFHLLSTRSERNGRGAKKQRPMADSALAYLSTVKDAFKDDREKFDKFLELMKNFTADRFNLVSGIEEVKELLKGHRDLIFGFNVFLPKGFEIKLPLEDEQPPQKKLDVFVEAKKFMHKIETRFHGQDNVYKAFLAILKMHKDGNRTPLQLTRRLESDLSEWEKDYRDYYQDGIQKLLSLKWRYGCMIRPFCNADEHFGIHPMSCTCSDQSSKKSGERFAFCAKVKDKVQNPKNYFSKHVGIYSKEKITQQELQLWATDFLRIYPDLMKGFNECVTQCKKMNEEVYVGSVKKKSSRDEEHVHKQIKFQIPSSSQRTKLDAEVLNDHWKCVASSTKDYSSIHISKNSYEMNLLECEDDRIELDVCLETAKSTTKQVEELIEKINTNMIERHNPINIEKHLRAQNLRWIEQLYGDHGIDVLDVLRKNASRVLPVILTRLRRELPVKLASSNGLRVQTSPARAGMAVQGKQGAGQIATPIGGLPCTGIASYAGGLLLRFENFHSSSSIIKAEGPRVRSCLPLLALCYFSSLLH
ncbi:Paired amphipathic helix protein Sin3-like 2 isoform B, partial [Glycine soja]